MISHASTTSAGTTMTTKDTIFCFRELLRVLGVFFLDGVAISLSFNHDLNVSIWGHVAGQALLNLFCLLRTPYCLLFLIKGPHCKTC
jgi:hypothetical protein